jgi:hypothetical protein
VVERIRDDEISLLDNARRESFICIPGRDVGERRFGSGETGNRFLELAVNREGAADESDTSRAGAVFLESFDSCADD